MSERSTNDLYRDTVLKHNRKPHGYDGDHEVTHQASLHNQVCGDHVTVRLLVEHEQVLAASFCGESCAICTASASILCQSAVGRSVSALVAGHRDLERALGSNGDQVLDWPDANGLVGVRKFPSRVRCALLPWEASTKALLEASL
ncbi:MAG: iron-sulfur cluster assembly scaffold protein NifU [Lysobacteraceae bacterium]|nr:MAG: iron-sulfur cluster assembly scaffold protein NifU [Xanthomonadaceae bacterium]